MKLTNKRILVTGGAGFIPSHIVDLLVSKGAKVTALDNLKFGKLDNLRQSLKEIEFMKIDIRDYENVRKIIKRQDVVFHLAANADVPYSVANPVYDFETNAIGGFNVLRSCLGSSVEKIIYASTGAVYGHARYTPIDENHILDPISPYGVSKLSTEQLGITYFRTYGIPFTAIRIFNTYGERQPRFVMYDLLKKIYRNSSELSVLGTGEQTRDYCYVSDTVHCFILAAESEKSIGEIFNLSGGNPISIKDLVILILKTLNLKNTKVSFTGKSWKGDIDTLIADTNKTKKILGFNPKIDLEMGIKKLHSWLKKQ